ncbi:MAG: hypothetical protein FJ086_03265 [Deltaproteobacteria bacterium]|nr:hypothetical protein [Deltaproteobacteria bacterium]
MMRLSVSAIALVALIAGCGGGTSGSNNPNPNTNTTPGMPPCTTNPCLNGGTCTVSGSTFTCACAVGFSGRRAA